MLLTTLLPFVCVKNANRAVPFKTKLDHQRLVRHRLVSHSLVGHALILHGFVFHLAHRRFGHPLLLNGLLPRPGVVAAGVAAATSTRLCVRVGESKREETRCCQQATL